MTRTLDTVYPYVRQTTAIPPILLSRARKNEWTAKRLSKTGRALNVVENKEHESIINIEDVFIFWVDRIDLCNKFKRPQV